MAASDALLARNADFAAKTFQRGLPVAPSLRMVIIACADQRADPTHVLELEPGEAAVIRNPGGRVTPGSLQAVAMLAAVAAGEGISGGFELVVMHHTDCGMTRLTRHEDLLADYFGVPAAEVEAKQVGDPRLAVEADLASLGDNPLLPSSLTVTGLVYDVETGLVETVAGPRRLREGER
jgi:carbonic anhydrase